MKRYPRGLGLHLVPNGAYAAVLGLLLALGVPLLASAQVGICSDVTAITSRIEKGSPISNAEYDEDVLATRQLCNFGIGDWPTAAEVVDLNIATLRPPSSLALPGTCTADRDVYVLNDSPVSDVAEFYFCTSTDTWSLMSGTASTGDSATGFFAAGLLEATRGGTNLDTSASTGIARVASGTWSTDAGISHLASSTSSDLRTVLSDETGLGVAVFADAPTFVGDITLDDTVADSPALVLTPATGVDWQFLVIDSDDDLEVQANTSSGVENVEIRNLGTGTIDLLLELTDASLTSVTSANHVTADRFVGARLPELCESEILENLAAADDNLPLAMWSYAVTIVNLGVHCDGTCSTPADIDLSDRAANAMTHGSPTVSVTTGNTTFTSVTAANALVAGEGLEYSVANAVSPETDTYTLSYCWTID